MGAEKQANAIGSAQTDNRAVTHGLNKELQEWKQKCDELDRKLKGENKELRQITEQHKKTEKKLKEVLNQAENETNRTSGDNEMLQLRLKSLKQQLDISES